MIEVSCRIFCWVGEVMVKVVVVWINTPIHALACVSSRGVTPIHALACVSSRGGHTHTCISMRVI